MQISLLQAFLLIEKHGSYSIASEKLHLSQSALSKHMQMLENLIGTDIFIRKGKGIALTPAGAALLPYAQAIISRHNDMMQVMREYSNTGVHIVYMRTPFLYDHYDLFCSFFQKYPTINMTMYECEMNEALTEIENKTADFALLRLSKIPEKTSSLWRIATLDSDTFVVICHKDHPFTKLQTISMEQIIHEKLILFKSTHLELLHSSKPYRIHSELNRPIITTTSIPFIMRCVAEENMISIMERQTAERLIAGTNLYGKEISDVDEVRLELFARDGILTTECKNFIDFVKHEIKMNPHMPSSSSWGEDNSGNESIRSPG